MPFPALFLELAYLIMLEITIWKPLAIFIKLALFKPLSKSSNRVISASVTLHVMAKFTV